MRKWNRVEATSQKVSLIYQPSFSLQNGLVVITYILKGRDNGWQKMITFDLDVLLI